MLSQRLLFGALLIATVCGLVWGDLSLASRPQPVFLNLDLSSGSLVPLVVGLLSTLGAVEALRLARNAGHQPLHFVVLLCVVVMHGSAGVLPALASSTSHDQALIIELVLSFVAIGCAQIARRRTDRAMADMACSLFIVIYMGVLPAFITAMRTTLPGSAGVWAVVLFVAVVKLTDIGAYFTGMSFGRTKLIPAISPAKTVEGLCGGLVFAAVAAIILSRVLPWPAGSVSVLSWTQAMGFGISIALLGQAGDLVESLLKRDADTKDSGQLVPAFGGILDLLDSPAFAAPVGYLLIRSWLA